MFGHRYWEVIEKSLDYERGEEGGILCGATGPGTSRDGIEANEWIYWFPWNWRSRGELAQKASPLTVVDLRMVRSIRIRSRQG